MVTIIEFQDIGAGYAPSGVVPVGDKILDLINVFDDNYLNQLDLLKTDLSEDSDILDKIGSLFGLKRNFSVSYNNHTYELQLDDAELLLLIRCMIIKNNCDGSREMLQDFYEKAGLKVVMKTSGNGTVEMTLLKSASYNYSENAEHMFLSGLLNIECVGIAYSYVAANLEDILIWQGYDINGLYHEGQNFWDIGEWAA